MTTTARERWRSLAAAVAALATIGVAVPASAQAPAAPAASQAPATPAGEPAAPAAAKPGATKFFVSADGGGQLASAGITSHTAYTLYRESASVAAELPDGGGASLSVRAAVRVWRRLAIGAGVTGVWSTRTADVSASVPHPFFFNRPRAVEGEAPGLARTESMVAVECAWMARLTPRMDLQVFGGPAFFSVRADLPASVRFTESYPYDAATLSGVETARVSGSAAGFTVGGDVSYMFGRAIGVGGHVRFSRAGASLTPPGGQSTPVDLGGVQAGGGLRVRF